MSRVTLGASLLMAIACLSLPGNSIAQSDQGELEAPATGERGGYGGEYEGRGGGYGGEHGGRGGYRRAAADAESPFTFEDDGTGRGGGEGRGGNGAVGSTPEGGSSSAATEAAERIEAILNDFLKSPLQYDEQPFNEIINMLSEEYDIPIMFDNAALDEVAITPDNQISINLRNVTLRSALNLMLRQPGFEDLTFVIDEEVLLITTEEKANEKMTVEVYRVDDLTRGVQQVFGSEKNPYSSLVEVVTRCVAYDSWMVNGSGEGEVRLMQPGMLVVTNTRRVHEQVQQLLEKLRVARADIDQEYSYGRGGRGGDGRF